MTFQIYDRLSIDNLWPFPESGPVGVNLPPGPQAIIHPYIQGDDPIGLAAGIHCFETVFTLLGLHYNVLLCYRFSLQTGTPHAQ